MAASELPTAYDAKAHEAALYHRWEAAGCFAAGAGKRGGAPYTIMIPPPNVTGVLHMGHALNNTLQDTLVRWQRMQGRDVLWQPGTDHAGIATQAVVAKELLKEGVNAQELPREQFLERIWRFKEQSGGTITKQLRQLGSSCDWSRERFTMDEGLSRAVRVNFVRLHQAGLLYRGTRMVNWDPVLKTALSDDEVEMVEGEGRMWKLRYRLADGSGAIEVETTRPETLFGDSALAVNATDPRYQAFIGKMVKIPVTGREIPVIADEHADPEKGTGAVKITPFHDPHDYQVGQRHNLPLVQCIGFDGVMNKEAGPYAGLDRYACRKQLLKDLKEQGVLLGERTIHNAVGHGDRSGVPIEPMVTRQWFVKMAPLAERALVETREGRVAFHPERWSKVYCHWLENVQDWCISRQIIWGHRIPAWHCADCGETTVALDDPTACSHCQSHNIRQDPDVLDTWFSSALWPFSTLGWPDATPELAQYYPTSTLVTDRGIIYFWVARMVMMGLFNQDTRPFDDVYIHGTVLDRTGAKMSKSKGNGIDPLVMIGGGTQVYLGETYECPGYGADAVRYTLLDMTTEGQDLKLEPSRFEGGRNFVNKVYNAGRFLLMNLDDRGLARLPDAAALSVLDLGFPERWILDRLQAAIDECTQALTAFRFSDYVGAAYRFFRDDLCDWYLEWAKRQLKAGGNAAAVAAQVLAHTFDASLRLLHPGMPFVSEFLWQQLQSVLGGQPMAEGQHLMLAHWPHSDNRLRSAGAATRMEQLQALVAAIRQVRNQQNLADKVALEVSLSLAETDAVAALESERAFLLDRANLSQLHLGVNLAARAQSLSQVVGTCTVQVSLAGVVDLGAYKAKLEKQLAAKEKGAEGKRGRLANASYVQGAPPEKVEETRNLLAADEAEIARLREALAGLG